jgi:HAD superfamily hydrolase (TIGR01484 family)
MPSYKATMKALSEVPNEAWRSIRAVGFDIDDTVTTDGRVTAEAYSALWALKASGLRVLAVTGRPAGWCDMIARTWPVDGVLGENGALFFRRTDRLVSRHDLGVPPAPGQLEALAERLLQKFPELKVASDQFCRRFDLAIDFAEEVGPFPIRRAEALAQAFAEEGAKAKVSSIHVNGWFGDWDKASGLQQVLRAHFDLDTHQLAYVGDSPNDGPLFAIAALSVGVANIRDFSELPEAPAYITTHERGAGFSEFAAVLLHEQGLP